MLNGLMKSNGWFPTMFDDFFNTQEHKHEDSHRHYLRREFSYSNYEQNYTLPDDVVRDKISAKVEDGILTITMPKTAPKEKVTKAIEVS